MGNEGDPTGGHWLREYRSDMERKGEVPGLTWFCIHCMRLHNMTSAGIVDCPIEPNQARRHFRLRLLSPSPYVRPSIDHQAQSPDPQRRTQTPDEV